MNYLALLNTVAPVFAVIAAGYAVRRVGWLNEEADASLLRVVVNLLYPCLILDTILGNPALARPGNLLLAPAAGFLTVAAGYALCLASAPLFGLRDAKKRRTFAFTAGIYNYGYLALPIIGKLFDAQTAGVLFIHNVGVEAALWTVGIALLAGASPGGGWRHLVNVPLIAILLALALNLARAGDWMPRFLLSAAHSIGAAAIPLGLILTGATFADQMRNLSTREPGAISLGACLLRLGVLPVLFLGLARWLPCPVELKRVILVQAAMPSAVVPVILAKHYGGDPGTALRIVLVTSAVGIFTIPLWLRFGLWFVK